jgi:hypothetical protein
LEQALELGLEELVLEGLALGPELVQEDSALALVGLVELV